MGGLLMALAMLALGAAQPEADIAGSCPELFSPQPHITEAMEEFGANEDEVGFWADTERLTVLNRELGRLVFDGLPPARYRIHDLEQVRDRVAAGMTMSPCDARAASFSFLLALSDLTYGKLQPHELGLIWYAPETHRPRQASTLLALAEQGKGDLWDSFRAARPTLPRYRNLRNAYRSALSNLPGSWPELASGPTLRPGDTSPRVPALRQRLTAQGYLFAEAERDPQLEPEYFDATLAQAVAQFQRDHGLEADGIVGRKTREQLDIPPTARLAEVRANLERLRWLARDVEPDMVLVDIAGASIELYRQGQRVWTGRTQVGRPQRPTPRLKSLVSHVTINPTWTVPPTVLYQDIVPAQLANPNYLADSRIRALGPDGNEVHPASVTWSNPVGITLRQDAGANNALGRMAIRFGNPFAVYLHDTPAQSLFATPYRFYSSGCVRVENVPALTRQLFEAGGDALVTRFETILASGETRNLGLARPTPIVMAYWTAQADEAGKISYRDDIYLANTQVIDLLDSQ